MKKFRLANDNELKIEKNIPIPPVYPKKKDYPYKEMKVGDSFFISTKKQTKEESRKLKKALSASFTNKKPKKFSMRTVLDGIRVWRIE